MTITEAQYRKILSGILEIQIRVEEHSGDFLTDDDIEPILETLEEIARQNENSDSRRPTPR